MNFRRWITALAVLTLFAGLAVAQTSGTGGGTAMNCSTIAQVTPTVRAEGMTELVGDILITCSGGSALVAGAPIPAGNIVVSLTAQSVTSRLGASQSDTNGTPSEAILMIDEPNSGLIPVVAGYGPAAPLSVCGAAGGTGCTEYVGQSATGIPLAVSDSCGVTNTCGLGDRTFNVFQGNVSAPNIVTFQGVPFLPPASAGVVRVFRITNIRINASLNGVTSGYLPINAQISTNGAQTLPISNSSITVAFVTPSMVPKVDGIGTNYQQCMTSAGQVATLHFQEQFPSAFKTRINPVGTTAGAGAYSSYLGTTSAGYYMQNVPGQLYLSESGFILPVNGQAAGLADFGTRFKAVFANLPAGATIYVSQQNTNAGSGNIGYFNPIEPSIAYATTGESSAFTAPGTTTVAGVTVVPILSAGSGGAATAYWEVVNTNTSADEDFQFGVYISYAANTTANTPALTVAAATSPNAATATQVAPTVTLSYAPTTSTSSIPRFAAPASPTAWGIINIVPCQTILLFPYVTSQAGFDTGIAISNTSMDPWGTPNTAGICNLYFYGQNAPTNPVATPAIPAGTEWANTAFSYVPYTGAGTGFAGYIFAQCNFQFAHGFAFVSDYGARNLAMGYLALVVTNGAGSISRNSKASIAGEMLEN
jgi:hypothetical protein